VNKDYLPKAVGFHVRLRPAATDRGGRVWDEDWVIEEVTRERVRLSNLSHGYTKLIGTDHVYSFYTDPDRDHDGIRYGFLQLLVSLTLDGNKVHLEPLPSPRTPNTDAAVFARRFAPLTIEIGRRMRYFSWLDRDPLYLIEREEEPRQLGLALSTALLPALHLLPDVHPRFNLATKVRGDVVYELAPDYGSKWKLLGGTNNGTGDQILVLHPGKG
jgi:hypothetical protein